MNHLSQKDGFQNPIKNCRNLEAFVMMNCKASDNKRVVVIPAASLFLFRAVCEVMLSFVSGKVSPSLNQPSECMKVSFFHGNGILT
ncbi:CLUMA_CG001180, isoform A [Clunio marinus]|uniref:CLUMA_CG001180, isoform A n=1 Tax=Clunio marinus TaxID=568069 RepID=A0A1J1HIJ4_9DIPT|nr:CLUMA_CG001180, isoform A [Clunio marinus]